jgi:hypothetical protein
MLPIYPCKGLTSKDFDHMEEMYHIQFEDELLRHDWLELYATKILHARYRWTIVKDIVNAQQHLTAHQKCNLLELLRKLKSYLMVLLVLTLTRWFTSTSSLAQPVHVFPLPCLAFICPLSNMNWIVPQQESEWTSPSFIIPKKMVASTGLVTYVN